MSHKWINILKLYEAVWCFVVLSISLYLPCEAELIDFRTLQVVGFTCASLSRSRIGKKCRKDGNKYEQTQIPIAELSNFFGQSVGKLFLW